MRIRTLTGSAARTVAWLPVLFLAGACVSAAATVTPTPVPADDASAGCDRPLGESVTQLAINVGGDLRLVGVHRPPPSISSGPLPLLLAVHGLADTAGDMERMSLLSDEADARGLVVAYQQAHGDPPRWNLSGSSDVAFLERAIDAILAKSCIDTRRVFATGFFDGGSVVARLGCDDARQVAAIAIVAGLYGEAFGGTCTSARPIPLMVIHGQKDPVAPYDGGRASVSGDETLDGAMADPVEDWAAGWASHNGCALRPQELPAIGAAAPLLWTECDAPVELVRVANGRHDWPGGDNDCGTICPPSDISATRMMLEFFEAHPLDGH